MSSKHRLLWDSAGGNTPEHWEFKTIEELLEHSKSISVGVMYPGSDTSGGIPLIRVSDVKNGAIASQPEFCVAKEVDEEYKRTRLNGTELLITLVGNPGDCVVVTEEMAGWNAARALAVVRLEDIELRAWIRYVLLSKPAKHLIEARLNTTVQKTLNLKDIREMGIPIPPKGEREKVTTVIDAIENKMLLNRQTNQTLEQIAQAIFKSWFVDFEPTRAKIAAKQRWKAINETIECSSPTCYAEELDSANQHARLKNQSLDDAMTQAAMAAISGKTVDELENFSPEQQEQLKATAALFPDALVESELGEIPEGWGYREAIDVSDVSIGKTPPRKESQWFSDEATDVRWVSIKDMGEAGTYIQDTNEYLTEEAISKFNVRRIPNNTVILSFKMTVGRLAITDGEMLSNEAIAHFILKEDSSLSTEYLYLYLAGFSFESMGSTSSIATAVNSKMIKRMPVLVPSDEVLGSFNKRISPVFQKIKSLISETRSLIGIRDISLPKLLSGELIISPSEVA